MTIIACIDDSGGMTFNGRRQSQDVRLKDRVIRLTNGSVLLMNSYSKKMFGDYPQISVDENFLENAADGEYCFAEDIDVAPYEERAERIILYKWNRRYPADLVFGVNLNNGWRLIAAEDFQGNSHEKITEEIYERID